jgi:hypothetical protein
MKQPIKQLKTQKITEHVCSYIAADIDGIRKGKFPDNDEIKVSY